MIFERPLFLLLLLLLPVLWIWMGRVPGASRACLILKCAVFAALVIALADPWANLAGRKMAATVLMDTSASMTQESIQRGEAIVRDLVRRNSSADLRLITFADRSRINNLPSQASDVAIPQVVDPNFSMGTDVEGAMQLALDTFPEDGIRRILLISDGNETRGDALTATLRAREMGVAVFTVPSGGTAKLPVELETAAFPQEVLSGERSTLSLQLNLDDSSALPARIWATSGVREVGASTVTLQPGNNAVNLDIRFTGDGLSQVDVHVSSNGVEQQLFSQAVTVRRPRVLYISGVGGGTSEPLLETLKRADVDVEMATAFPSNLPETGAASADWDAVLLDNYPDHLLSDEENAAIEKYVYTGGGLIFIAGPDNSQLSEEPKTPLEKLLPVSGDLPPVSQEPTALMLVLDRSLSMEGEKIAIVRQAARASIATIRPIDKIGVITFDQEFRWILPLAPAKDVAHVNSLIDGITAGGGTRIYPALNAAFQAIRAEPATRKHIILLTDGVSPPGDLPQLEKDAAAAHISISCIGIGDDVDKDFLEEIARNTKGRSYFIEDPKKIEQIISNETKDLETSPIEEHSVRAVRVRSVELTDGVDFASAPHLLGFVKTKAKKDAEVILRLQSGEPLLARWQYGLGRVIAFTSDARGRWAAPWVRWPAFGTLWPQMVRDVSRRDAAVRVGLRAAGSDGAGNGGDQIVYYDAVEGSDSHMAAAFQGSTPPQILVSAPDGSSQQVPLRETSPGHYEARVSAQQQGLYRIASASAALQLPATGFYREVDEMKPREVNVDLLSQISNLTGGRVFPTTAQLLDDSGSLVRERRALWPYWLVLALLLNFFEVALRKGHFARIASRFQRKLPALSSMEHAR
jgi:Ca-activated chloride channel homolog